MKKVPQFKLNVARNEIKRHGNKLALLGGICVPIPLYIGEENVAKGYPRKQAAEYRDLVRSTLRYKTSHWTMVMLAFNEDGGYVHEVVIVGVPDTKLLDEYMTTQLTDFWHDVRNDEGMLSYGYYAVPTRTFDFDANRRAIVARFEKLHFFDRKIVAKFVELAGKSKVDLLTEL